VGETPPTPNPTFPHFPHFRRFIMNEYKIEYECNGKHAKAIVLATTRAEAAKWMCKYEKNRGNAYKLLKATKIKY
jgi:hypothetical protein